MNPISSFEMVTALEAEADNGVRDRRSHLVDREQVDAVEFRQVVAARFEGRGEIGFAAIVEVTDIVHGNAIALDRGAQQLRDPGLPAALVRRFDIEKPEQHDREQSGKRGQRAGAPAARKDREKGQQTGKAEYGRQDGLRQAGRRVAEIDREH